MPNTTTQATSPQTCAACDRRTCGYTVEYPNGTVLLFCGGGCRTAHTAAKILALPSQAEHEDLLVAHRTWAADSDQTPAARKALAGDDYDGFIAALGTPESMQLTADGRTADTTAWCLCGVAANAAEWVRYERWTAKGRVSHGYVCPTVTCRKLLQTG